MGLEKLLDLPQFDSHNVITNLLEEYQVRVLDAKNRKKPSENLYVAGKIAFEIFKKTNSLRMLELSYLCFDNQKYVASNFEDSYHAHMAAAKQAYDLFNETKKSEWLEKSYSHTNSAINKARKMQKQKYLAETHEFAASVAYKHYKLLDTDKIRWAKKSYVNNHKASEIYWELKNYTSAGLTSVFAGHMALDLVKLTGEPYWRTNAIAAYEKANECKTFENFKNSQLFEKSFNALALRLSALSS